MPGLIRASIPLTLEGVERSRHGLPGLERTVNRFLSRLRHTQDEEGDQGDGDLMRTAFSETLGGESERMAEGSPAR
jgi:hypothetical protein